jgi:diacylglycerol kinase family enzyme
VVTGQAKSGRILRKNFIKQLSRQIAFTERPGHGTILARNALMEGYEQLLYGGDGTINEVVMVSSRMIN